MDKIIRHTMPMDYHDVLLVGRMDPNVMDIHRLPRHVRHCRSMLDAITLSGQQRFDAIYVVVTSVDGHLESALGALRRMCRGARIVLLVEMHQEVLARQLVGPVGSMNPLVDDYLIFPMDVKELFRPRCPVTPSTEDDASISALMKRIRELEQLATQDDLTGLKNRRYIREFLTQILSRAGQQDMRVTLLMFDIDNFKRYNDLYGHSVGDNVLRQAAVMMLRSCRKHDVVGRIGGDEFAVIFWDLPSKTESARAQPGEGFTSSSTDRRKIMSAHPRHALFMAERFRRQLSDSDLSSLGAEGKGTLTISGGLASFPQDGRTAEELFEKADRAMLEAKRSGKNRIVIIGKEKS